MVTLMPCIIRRANGNRHSVSVFSHLLGSEVVILSSRIGSRATSLIITRLLFLRNRSGRGSVGLCVGSPNNSIASNVTVCSAVRCVGYSISAVYVNVTTSVNTFLLSDNAGNGHVYLPGTRIVVRRPLNRAGNRTARVRVTTGRVLGAGGGLGDVLTTGYNGAIRRMATSARESG